MTGEIAGRLPTASELAELLAQRVDGLIPELLPGARQSGGYWTAGNVQGDIGGSLYIHRSGAKCGRWNDAATGQFGDLLDLVNQALYAHQNLGAAIRWASAWLGLNMSNPRPAVPPRASRPKAYQHDGDEAAIGRARAIWAATQPIADTRAERYLRVRAITIPLPPTLRYAPALIHHATGTALPALIAGISGPEQQVTAVQRIYLRLDGSGKASVAEPKMTLGRMLAGACRLAPVGHELGLAEGVETGLSAMELYRISIWVACGSRMDAIAIPVEVKRLVIFGDNGAVGSRAAERAATQHERAGRSVEIKSPPANYGDFNDVAKAAPRAA